MTDKPQELDEMLREYKLAVTDDTGSAWQQEERIAEAKQAILDWHKQEIAKARVSELLGIKDKFGSKERIPHTYYLVRVADLSQTLKESKEK